jgi:hypothetical protein
MATGFLLDLLVLCLSCWLAAAAAGLLLKLFAGCVGAAAALYPYVGHS